MGIVEKKVETVQQEYLCDDCGKGKLAFTGIIKLTSPPLYTHQCDNAECKKTKDFRGVKYPHIAYKVVE